MNKSRVIFLENSQAMDLSIFLILNLDIQQLF